MNQDSTDQITIAQARDIMRPKLEKGTVCLCCGQQTRQYKRIITSAMCQGLIYIYTDGAEHMTPDGYIHLENFFKDLIGVPSSIRGDLPKCRFWGLLEPRGATREDDNPCDGYYKLTQKGKQFVEGKILVRKAVKLYNNKFYGFHGPEIDIFGAIKNKFNYSRLMGLKKVA